MPDFSAKLRIVIELYHSRGKTVWQHLRVYPEPELYQHLLTNALTPMDGDNLRQRLSRTTHQRDSRKLADYAREILLNWLVEDYVIAALSGKQPGKIQLSGTDRQRQFLAGPEIAAAPDILVDGKPFDIKSDWTNYWSQRQVIDLRDDEYLLLKERRAGLILFQPLDRCYAILHDLGGLTAARGKRHPVWQKPFWQVALPEDLRWQQF